MFFVQANVSLILGEIMFINLSCVSPFYAAYVSQSGIINAAIEKAIEESAEKMGTEVLEIYSICASSSSEEKLAA